MNAKPYTESEDAPHNAYDYDVFISYRTAEEELDNPVAEELQRVLEAYPVPRSRRGMIANPKSWRNRLRVFRDETEIPAAPDISEELEKNLKRSRFLIVIATTSLPKSDHCTSEIAHFLEHHELKEKEEEWRIQTLLLEGTPENSFPECLGKPFAPDIRADTLEESLTGQRQVRAC